MRVDDQPRDLVALVGDQRLGQEPAQRHVREAHPRHDGLLGGGGDPRQPVARPRRRRLGHQLPEVGEHPAASAGVVTIGHAPSNIQTFRRTEADRVSRATRRRVGDSPREPGSCAIVARPPVPQPDRATDGRIMPRSSTSTQTADKKLVLHRQYYCRCQTRKLWVTLS